MIIYLGSVYPQSLLEKLTSRRLFADYPANVFQHSLLKGLDEHLLDLTVVSSPVIHSSNAAVKDICHRRMFSHKGGGKGNDLYVGTVVIPGLQLLAELWKVYWAIRHLTKKTEGKPNIIIYALHSPFLLACVLLKRRINHSCVIVPDLPEFMSRQESVVKKCGKKIDRVIINFCLKRLDSYVLLSPYMREKLPIKGKPWALMEGIFDIASIPQDVQKCEERVVLYCGNLSWKYGVIDLLMAFIGISKDNYRLWICGRGDAEAEIVQKTKEDERIKFYGVVSHDEVLKLQQQATVLINPRSSTGEYTKYSFPSKTMEYLASGTPTIMCHLPAIPKEYDEHIFYIEDESVSGIKAKIEEVCEKSQQELDVFGKRAAEFIRKNKNAYVQAQKVVNMISIKNNKSNL